MSTLREAVQHARNGGTARCGGKEIRFLTFEEAEPIILELSPSRRTVIDEKTGKTLIEDGEIVVETYADPNFNTKRLGLYVVGDSFSSRPPEQFRATEEDAQADWSVGEPVAEAPAVVAPETVDEVLSETTPQ